MGADTPEAKNNNTRNKHRKILKPAKFRTTIEINQKLEKTTPKEVNKKIQEKENYYILYIVIQLICQNKSMNFQED